MSVKWSSDRSAALSKALCTWCERAVAVQRAPASSCPCPPPPMGLKTACRRSHGTPERVRSCTIAASSGTSSASPSRASEKCRFPTSKARRIASARSRGRAASTGSGRASTTRYQPPRPPARHRPAARCPSAARAPPSVPPSSRRACASTAAPPRSGERVPLLPRERRRAATVREGRPQVITSSARRRSEAYA